MANCPKCGATMVHFENPSRYECPKESEHGEIWYQAQKGGRRKGAGKKPGTGGKKK